MPHSEYPSASACLCRGIEEFVQAYLTVQGISSFPLVFPRAAGSSYVEPGTTPATQTDLVYPDVAAMAAACSRSRLDGGLHFTAAVPAGEDLCDGIGDQGFAFATTLINGQWNWSPPTIQPSSEPSSSSDAPSPSPTQTYFQ